MNHATVVLRLRGPHADEASLESAAVEATWATATPEDSIEHVHAQVMRDRLYVTLHRVGRDREETRAIARELCRRTIATSPFLSRVVHGEIKTIVLPLKSFGIDP
ncbi:hypothetical protein [Saccharothrix syringae]|uniref:Uncharacterized protein n=1 Tax=Saccharothrix syringae TaxID=103733 RepID=A0A5Q0H551_SACSY|nr:hypothetical protein [Saccharothrix syringae]QFZ20862.1 hypothetical protein EKG83_28830 [Saccharothrix syringae]